MNQETYDKYMQRIDNLKKKINANPNLIEKTRKITPHKANSKFAINYSKAIKDNLISLDKSQCNKIKDNNKKFMNFLNEDQFNEYTNDKFNFFLAENVFFWYGLQRNFQETITYSIDEILRDLDADEIFSKLLKEINTKVITDDSQPDAIDEIHLFKEDKTVAYFQRGYLRFVAPPGLVKTLINKFRDSKDFYLDVTIVGTSPTFQFKEQKEGYFSTNTNRKVYVYYNNLFLDKSPNLSPFIRKRKRKRDKDEDAAKLKKTVLPLTMNIDINGGEDTFEIETSLPLYYLRDELKRLKSHFFSKYTEPTIPYSYHLHENLFYVEMVVKDIGMDPKHGLHEIVKIVNNLAKPIDLSLYIQTYVTSQTLQYRIDTEKYYLKELEQIEELIEDKVGTSIQDIEQLESIRKKLDILKTDKKYIEYILKNLRILWDELVNPNSYPLIKFPEVEFPPNDVN